MDPEVDRDRWQRWVHDGQGGADRWPWSGRWIRHVILRTSGEVESVTINDRTILVPWHGRVILDSSTLDHHECSSTASVGPCSAKCAHSSVRGNPVAAVREDERGSRHEREGVKADDTTRPGCSFNAMIQAIVR